MGSLEQLDKNVSLAINLSNGGGWDGFMQTMSHVSLWFGMYALVAAALLWRLGWKKGLVVIAGVILFAVASDQIANLVKNGFCRLRPCYDEWMVAHGVRILENKGGLYGFYSAHASSSFGFALSTMMGFYLAGERKAYQWIYAIGIFLWAALVSISRVFVAKHFLGDVLCGAVAGSLLAYGIMKLISLLPIFKR